MKTPQEPATLFSSSLFYIIFLSRVGIRENYKHQGMFCCVCKQLCWSCDSLRAIRSAPGDRHACGQCSGALPGSSAKSKEQQAPRLHEGSGSPGSVLILSGLQLGPCPQVAGGGLGAVRWQKDTGRAQQRGKRRLEEAADTQPLGVVDGEHRERVLLLAASTQAQLGSAGGPHAGTVTWLRGKEY